MNKIPLRIVRYTESSALLDMWCKHNDDVEGRNGCMNDKQCLDNARDQCDKNPDCYGVSWYTKKTIKEQDLKLCLSREMEPKTDGWRTMMKSEGNHISITVSLNRSNLIFLSISFVEQLQLLIFYFQIEDFMKNQALLIRLNTYFTRFK